MFPLWVFAMAACTSDGSPPQWLSVPSEVAAGGWLWGVIERPESVQVRIDGVPLVLEKRTEFAAVWKVPALDAGPTTLDLVVPGTPGVFDRRELLLHEPAFVNVAAAVGLQFEHQVAGWDENCAESLAPVAVTDWDLDGDFDVFAGNLTAPSVAWQADTSAGELGEYDEVTDTIGLGGLDLVASASFADFDSDGDPDLLVGRRGPNVLLENRMVPDGAPMFVDISERLPDNGDRRTTGAAWGDLDGDADLDVYLTNHHWCFPRPSIPPQSEDQLLRNDGDGFVDLTASLDDDDGRISDRLGFAALWVDVDRDADLDLIVANDAVGRRTGNVLWHNEPGQDPPLVPVVDSTIDPVSDAVGKGANAMGIDIGDIDLDGTPDLATSNIGPTILLLGDGDGGWVESGGKAGVQRTVHPWGDQGVTWATHLFDRDLDGDLDLFLVGGALRGEQPQPHALFDGHGDGTFHEISWTAGLASPGHGKSSAIVDLDQDGQLDLLVANWDGPLEVWHNRSAGLLPDPPHHLVVDVVGDGVEVSTAAFGAIVEVTTADGLTRTCWRTSRPSMSSTGDPACHFGLGTSDTVTALRVIWPDGTVDEVEPPSVDQRITVTR